MIENFKNWFSENKKNILDDYISFLKFKTISSLDSKKEMENCSKFLSEKFKSFGFSSEIIETSTFPLVYAEKIADKNVKTLLIYGHYDVQPVDPINEWEKDPFEPTLKDNNIYARGASDNKGQILYAIMAARAVLEIYGGIDLNIKFLIEGEEENKSKGLFKKLDSIKNKIAADYLLVVDLNLPDKDTPAITLGIRGMMSMSLEFKGSSIDLHSGEHGGLAYNPLRAAVEVLSKLVDENGKVNIQGFYDDVEELTESNLKEYDFIFDENKYKNEFGIKNFGGEKKYKGIKANWLRPTLEINGIGGGYFEKGFKTVIPSIVVVKLSCRLVPNQDPKKIYDLVKDFIKKNTQDAIDVKIDYEGGGFAIRTKATSILAQATKQAYEEIFNTPCKKILSGGSVPVIAEIVDTINCQPVMMGLALSSDNFHAPNEHFGLDRFEKGFLIVAKTLMNLADKTDI